MEALKQLMSLIDANSEKIPEGDYLELCDTIQTLREQVKPPSFLINQNQPLMYTPTIDDTLPSDPETAAQRDREQLYQRWRELDEEVMYPGLNEFLQELHEEWTDREDGTSVVEVNSPPETWRLYKVVLMDLF